MANLTDECPWSEKPYSNATDKLRCVLAVDFYPDASMRVLVDGLVAQGVPHEQVIALCQVQIDEHDSKALIESSIGFTFKPREKYTAGRFNTEYFPALYTAKEDETALREKAHYIKSIKSDIEVPAVVYSLIFSGKLADLRPSFASGALTLTDDHSKCRSVAEQVYTQKKLDGVAAPSARKSPGNCCAIFNRECVRVGEIVREVSDLHSFA